MRAVLSLLLVTALGGTAGADTGYRAMMQAMAQAVIDAVAHQDAAAFARLAPSSLEVSSIWFDSAACARQFSGVIVVQKASYPALLKCLGTLGLRAAPLDAGLPGLAYDPGVRLELFADRGELRELEGTWLGEPTAAPITQDALASHAISPTVEVEPDPDIRDAVLRTPYDVAFVELTTCVDRTGKLESARLRRHSVGHDSYVHAVEAGAASRKFKPFTAHGKSVRVCARELFTYPATRRDEALTGHPIMPARTPELLAAEDTTAQAVLDAITRQDAAAFATLVPPDAVISSIWFADPPCAKQFSGIFAPTDPIRAALLKCLAGLGLRLGSRQQLRGLGPWPTLVYDPGVVLELAIRDGAVFGIDTVWEFTGDPSAAPVSPEALEAHLIAPVTVEPDAEVRDALSSAKEDLAYVQLLACVDRTGKLESVRTVLRSKGYDSYVHAVEAAAARWKFTPFKLHDKPVRVCGLDLVAYPPDRRDQFFAPPPPPPRNVVPAELEALRIAGEKNILPDDLTKVDIRRSGKSKLVGSYKLCISIEGTVTDVRQMKSTGFADYDEKIMSELRQWRYRPYLVDGKPAPVCTAVSFIYSQK